MKKMDYLASLFGEYPMNEHVVGVAQILIAGVLSPSEMLLSSDMEIKLAEKHRDIEKAKSEIDGLKLDFLKLKKNKKVHQAVETKKEIQNVILKKILPLNREIYDILTNSNERNVVDCLHSVNLIGVRDVANREISGSRGDIKALENRLRKEIGPIDRERDLLRERNKEL